MEKKLPTDVQGAMDSARDILHSISERDIYTGDGIELCVVDKSGVRYIREKLRWDWNSSLKDLYNNSN